MVQGNPFIGEPPDVKKQHEIIECLGSLEYLDGGPVVEVRKKVEAANAQSAGMQDVAGGSGLPSSGAVVPGGSAGGAMATKADKSGTPGASRKGRGGKAKDEAPPSLNTLL